MKRYLPVHGWFLSGLLLPAALICARASMITYTYDAAGRLTSAEYGGGKSISYVYDPAGNLTQLIQTAPSTDSDNDGLDDNWERLFFGNTSRDGSGDFDSDGLTDRAEFLAGTDPTSAVSVLRVSALPTVDSGTATITWSSVPGKTYQVQYKNGLEEGTWTNLGPPINATGNSATFRDSSLTGVSQRFYRIILVP